MKRRYAVFALVFDVSLLIGIQAVEGVAANPHPWFANPQMTVSILSTAKHLAIFFIRIF
jgi:hypothetical protein